MSDGDRSPEDISHWSAMPTQDLWMFVCRRRWWLVAVAAVAAALAALQAVVSAWLLRPSEGWSASGRFGAATFLMLTASGVALVVTVDRRPGRRVVSAVLTVVLVLQCSLPAGWFWTYAVSHGPTGAACPSCAVYIYFDAGPLGDGWTSDSMDFDSVLCPNQRGRLKHQTQQFVDEIALVSLLRPRAGSISLHSQSIREQTRGRTATVIRGVQATQTYRDGTGSTKWIDSITVPWTFYLTNDDGWRICKIDAPSLCDSEILNCQPPPPPTDNINGVVDRPSFGRTPCPRATDTSNSTRRCGDITPGFVACGGLLIARVDRAPLGFAVCRLGN